MAAATADSPHGTRFFKETGGRNELRPRAGRGSEGFRVSWVREIDSKIAPPFRLGKRKKFCILLGCGQASMTYSAKTGKIPHRHLREIMTGDASVMIRVFPGHRLDNCDLMAASAVQRFMFRLIMRKARTIAPLMRLILGVPHGGTLGQDKSYAGQQ